MSKSERKTCPSSVCKEGSNLIGIINKDGIVDLLSVPITVDKEFIEIASQGRRPEIRFRFSGRCVEGACKQWTGTTCGVIENVLDIVEEGQKVKSLPSCGIRSTCRWFHQEGAAACYVCPLIITDNCE